MYKVDEFTSEDLHQVPAHQRAVYQAVREIGSDEEKDIYVLNTEYTSVIKIIKKTVVKTEKEVRPAYAEFDTSGNIINQGQVYTAKIYTYKFVGILWNGRNYEIVSGELIKDEAFPRTFYFNSYKPTVPYWKDHLNKICKKFETTPEEVKKAVREIQEWFRTGIFQSFSLLIVE